MVEGSIRHQLESLTAEEAGQGTLVRRLDSGDFGIVAANFWAVPLRHFQN